MRNSFTTLTIIGLALLLPRSHGAAQEAQWRGPARAEIRAFVRKQKGDVDLPFPIVFYGDFNGDREEDAVAFIYREIEGAAGNVDLKVALFKGAGGKYRFIRYAPDVYGYEPRDAKFSNGLVEITTTVLRPGDPRCCPTGSKRYAIMAR